MGMYYYRIDRHWDVGFGGGAIPIFGEDVDSLTRGVATVSAIYSPGGIWYIRTELSYLTNSITAADFGHPTSSFTIDPEPNFSVTIGFDLRRAGSFSAKPRTSR
jgi:hypothetical protein